MAMRLEIRTSTPPKMTRVTEDSFNVPFFVAEVRVTP
jgi:hypothetical protein